MLLLAKEVAIRLEVVDAAEAPISSIDARLRHLTTDRAVAVVSNASINRSLRWGSNIRFDIGDGDEIYTLLGSVVGHDINRGTSAVSPSVQEPKTDQDLTEIGSANLTECGDGEVESSSVSIRIVDCRRRDQRRATPRRYSKFPVQWRAEIAQDEPEAGPWNQGVCVDLGGGGMRLLTNLARPYPNRVVVSFCLQDPDSTFADSDGAQQMTMSARVLRVSESGPGSTTRQREIALRFDSLTVEHGMALSRHLAGSH